MKERNFDDIRVLVLKQVEVGADILDVNAGVPGEEASLESLFEAAHSAGVEFVSICGGKVSCGGCRVRVMSGKLSSPTPEEESFFTPIELEEGCRLACQAKPLTDVKVDVPFESLTTTQRLQVEEQGARVVGERIITPVDFVLEPESLTDLQSNTTRLRDVLQKEGYASLLFCLDVLFSL